MSIERVSLVVRSSLSAVTVYRKNFLFPKSYAKNDCFPKLTLQAWFIYCMTVVLQIQRVRSSPSEVFLGKSVLKICSNFTGEYPCLSETK